MQSIHFKVYNSIALSLPINLDYFHYSQKKPLSYFPIVLVLHPQDTNDMFSAPVDLPILGISYKWNHTT
jgi:hypothetical protein